MRAQPSSNKQQHKITDYRKDYRLRSTYIGELKPQSKAKVCYSIGISLNNPRINDMINQKSWENTRTMFIRPHY